MNKYFVKYLPTSGEIGEGDFYFQTYQAGQIGRANKEDYLNGAYKDLQKVKPFLCSREIGVGDEVQDEEGNKAMCESFTQAGLIRLRVNNEFYTDVIDSFFKVLGEISPHAIWAREGDEFTEGEVRFSYDAYTVFSGDDVDTFHVSEKEWLNEKIEEYSTVRKWISILCPTCQQFH